METANEAAQRCIDAGAFVTIAHPQWSGITLEDALSIKNDLLKVDIIVPFRDRHKHLKKFQKHFANVSNLYNLNIYIGKQ